MTTILRALPVAPLLMVAFVAPAAAADLVIIQPVEPPSLGWQMPAMPFDNVRFGLTQFQNSQVTRLFHGPGVSFGLDVPVGQGLAVAFDSMNLHQDYSAAQYWLSVNPLLARYRLGLTEDGEFRPFATLGAGLAGMALFGDAGRPRLGVGPAGSLGAGLAWGDRLALELGVQAGQVSQIPYWGWQLRLGTGFGSLDSLRRWFPAPAPEAAAAAKVPVAPARPLTGQVLTVEGDRLVVGYVEPSAPQVGDEVLVYYEDGITVKVAKARIESLVAEGQAAARVLDSTEPVKKGYRVRAW